MMAREPEPRADLPGYGRLEYPCSQSQLRFWIEEQLTPRNPALNVAVRWRLEGPLDHAVLEEAWQRLIHRHEPLRTALTTRDEEPVQVVEPSVAFAIPIVDLRTLPVSDRAREADRLAEIEARAPFDIATAPLIRVTRQILADDTTILLVTAHHAVCDGWSIGILAREMGQIGAALGAGLAPFLPDLALSFGEFARWERDAIAGGSFESERAYIQAMLRDSKQFELLPDFPRPRKLSSNGAIASVLLDRGLTDALGALARGNGATLFMTALTAVFALLSRYSGETDIVLGTQVVGRDDEELEALVGCFINTIALRADLSDDPQFVALLKRTRDMVSDTFDVRALPLQQLVEIASPLRDPSRNALFSVNFIFQRSFITNDTYGNVALIDLPSRSAGALYDLNLFMVERPEGWRVSCEYNTDLFEVPTVDGLLERFCNLLRSVVADPEQSITQIDILGAAQRHALVVDANQTAADYPAEKTLPQLVAEQVARSPHAVAVTGASGSLTYAQLAAGVQRVAGELAAMGCASGTRVGILLDRSPDIVVAMLAVLEAGCAYVPLDPKFPAERLAFIAADAELGATITRRSLTGRLDLTGRNPLYIDALGGQPARFGSTGAARFDIGALSAAPRSGLGAAPAASPSDVAYVIYTSGSTGNPKGVAIQHRALVNFLWAMRERPGMTADDTLVAVTTISFDIAGLELFLPLITGAKLVIATESDVLDGAALAGLLERSGATIVQATPVTWQLLVDAGWRGDPALKLLCGGEALSRPLAELLLDRCAELWNMYGPTETTIWSSAGRVTHGAGPVRIAPPIANTQFYVLDAAGNLVPPGVPGELYIGGDGVALGYFKRDELTRERFVANPFSNVPAARMYRTGDVVRMRGGEFEFLGRTDHQIKLRGFRIELDEIAAVLLRAPGVADAVAIAVDDGPDASVRAYVVAAAGAVQPNEDWPATLRSQIAEFLPNYMLPAAIVVLDRLPRTPNGKIDRATLPKTIASGLGSVRDVPVTASEIAVAQLVAELLGHSQFGRKDDLFGLGFHSLLAVRLVSRIARTLDVGLPLRAIFDRPTIAGIAGDIDAARSAPATAVAADPQPIVHYNDGGSRTPIVFFHNDALGEGLFCRRLAAAVGAEQPLLAVAPHGSAGLPALTTIESMARDYLDRLRRVQPTGPYRLAGFCAGGLVAYELARILRVSGESVEPVLLVNASAPPPRPVLFGDQLLRVVGLNPRLDPQLRAGLCWTIVRLFDSLGAGPRATFRFLGGRANAALRRLTRAPIARLNEPEPVNPHPTESETRSYFANLIAAYTYHPQPFEGEVVFMWGLDQPPTAGGPTTGWDRVARNIRTISLPGRHLSPVTEGVEHLGKIFAAEFAEVHS